tara:strand:- start:1548 stop:1736 length:189 start_codon:yes stop_codon:yes gene_type:complete
MPAFKIGDRVKIRRDKAPQIKGAVRDRMLYVQTSYPYEEDVVLRDPITGNLYWVEWADLQSY